MRKGARKRLRVNDGEKERFRNCREMSGAGKKAGETFAVGVADERRGKNGREVREFVAFCSQKASGSGSPVATSAIGGMMLSIDVTASGNEIVSAGQRPPQSMERW